MILARKFLIVKATSTDGSKGGKLFCLQELLKNAPLLLALLFFNFLHAQQTAQKFVREVGYLLSLPDHYTDDTSARWPLVLFLHGSGESGHDIDKVKVNGPPQLVDRGKKFPFILVSPQSDVPTGWDIDVLYKLLQDIKKQYRVNNQKVYVTGLSMGGFGTWALAMKYPDEFAAIAPVCGGGDTSTAWKLRNIPVWCFHGAKDDVVLPISSINLVNAARRYNSSVKFTLYPNANHNSWDTTYNNDSLYLWMLAQTKFIYRETPADISVLKNYEGRYLGPDGDTVLITANKNGLIAKPGHDTVLLKPAGENLFFLQPDKNMDIRFLRNKKAVDGLLFLGDRKLLYRKL
jgi:dienelactone hydrolase